MFTGIVEERGEIVDLQVVDGDVGGPAARLTVRGPKVSSDAGHGDSIAVAGVCLTVVDRGADTFTVDVMAETLHRSTLGGRSVGDPVNLERSVTAGTRLGGHIVQGHVDGVGEIIAREPHPAWDEFRFAVGPDLARYLAGKGAITIDGVSLTVVAVQDVPGGAEFTVGVIPETRAATTLGAARVGDRVNLEVDVIAKYVERLLQARDSA
ncbi:riboflavin synthase [Nakamurella flavida]|uniref:riboflavin synthase n=1 Tax=Nakamurella flavida TaxID=363630 RepID=UPI002783CD5B|nr:riboflavin synthase [Nakamurella flavida]MDP9777627.1 riboflavin synthase [Nakamurella flavida]